MNHTPQIKKSIQFAARKHHGQFRKETEPLPYITHLFSVALLVAEGGGDDDTVAAALLHDTIEDTDTTREEIVQKFNTRVADLVASVTEPKGLSWRERKSAYLENLKNANNDALLIAIADKIDNIESKLEALDAEGNLLTERWDQSPESYLWYHGEVLKIAQERLPDHSLTKRLLDVCGKERKLLG